MELVKEYMKSEAVCCGNVLATVAGSVESRNDDFCSGKQTVVCPVCCRSAILEFRVGGTATCVEASLIPGVASHPQERGGSYMFSDLALKRLAQLATEALGIEVKGSEIGVEDYLGDGKFAVEIEVPKTSTVVVADNLVGVRLSDEISDYTSYLSKVLVVFVAGEVKLEPL